jgi:hypothetical protein
MYLGHDVELEDLALTRAHIEVRTTMLELTHSNTTRKPTSNGFGRDESNKEAEVGCSMFVLTV